MIAAMPDVLTMPLPVVQGRVNSVWKPGLAGNHVIIGENGSGKTGLITRTIMPLCGYDRVLSIDVKGDDEMWDGYGVPIGRVTPGFHGQGDGPARSWYRLVVDMAADKAEAKRLVAEALDIALDEGHMTLMVDETRAITDREELNLGAKLEAVLLRGRSRRVSAILAAQATEYMVPSIRNQWAMAWLGSLKDDEVIKRTLKIVGLPMSYLPVIRDIPRRDWLYLDRESGKPMMALTTS